MSELHATVQRLLDFAREATSNDALSTEDIARLMNLKSGVMTNWKSRGISSEGAINAESCFGCSPSWLLTGEISSKRSIERDSHAPMEPSQTSLLAHLWGVANAAKEQRLADKRGRAATWMRLVVADPLLNAGDLIPMIEAELLGGEDQDYDPAFTKAA